MSNNCYDPSMRFWGPLPPAQDDGPLVLGLSWGLRSVAIIVVALRLYTRTLKKNTAGWDDLFIGLAAVCSILGGIVDTVRVDYGYGQHAARLSDEQISITNIWALVAEEVNFMALFFVRMSVVFFCLRLLPATRKWPRAFIYHGIALNVASTVVNILFFAIQSKISCQALVSGFIAGGALGVVTDFITVIIPIIVVAGLQMSTRTKISVSIVLGLSILTAACGIGKVVVSQHIRDSTWDAIPVDIFSLFEETCAIIFASAPAMRQLYTSLRDGSKKSTNGRSHVTPYQSQHGAPVYSARAAKVGDLEAGHTANGSRDDLVPGESGGSKKGASVELSQMRDGWHKDDFE